MDASSALIAFSIAAALLTVTPGLDTALVLRTAAAEGGRQAMRAGSGVSCGVLAWGLITALGLGALLAVSRFAYQALQIAGACYLLYLGARMLWAAWRRPISDRDAGSESAIPATAPKWFLRGLFTNLLNPKIGVFYVSFLPQFIPADANVVAFSVMLAAIHAVIGLAWFAALVLATRPLSRWLRRPGVVRGLDTLTGIALVAFGLRLALARPATSP